VERAHSQMATVGPSPSLDNSGLLTLRADFPQFRIWAETLGQRTRYTARRLDPGTSPHTVVTSDLDELRAALGGDQTPISARKPQKAGHATPGQAGEVSPARLDAVIPHNTHSGGPQ